MRQTMSLRRKLLLSLALPLAALIALSALYADGVRRDVEGADSQLAEVERATALHELALAVRSERSAAVGLLSLESEVIESRSIVDDAFTTIANVDLTAGERGSIERLRAEIDALRAAVPTDPAAIRETLASEPASETGSPEVGSVAWAFASYETLVAQTIDLSQFDIGSIDSAAQASELQTLGLLARLDDALWSETQLSVDLAQQPAAQTTTEEIGQLETLAARSTSFEITLQDFVAPRWQEGVSTFFDSQAYSDLAAVRSAVDDLEPGTTDLEVLDPIALAEIQTSVRQPLAELQVEAIDAVRQTSIETQQSTTERARRWLIVAGAVALALLLLLSLLYRSIRAPIRRLTTRATAINETELPETVALLRDPEHEVARPRVDAIAVRSADEIGDLAHAVNGLHSTAVDLATDHAASQRLMSTAFVNLGRRNRKHLLRILKSLDRLQEHDDHPERRAELAKVDHLAGRMRRNADSLLVLADGQATHRTNRPMAIGDVVQQALAQVEHHERVDASVSDAVAVAPSAVADLTHLLAELIENALIFSPHDRQVNVLARDARHGYLIAVIDQGFGLSPDDLDEYNRRIGEAASVHALPSKFLGLHVVGRLAARHGIHVELLEGVTSGITARVRIPPHLLDTDGQRASIDITDGSTPLINLTETGSTAGPTHRPTTTIAAPRAAASVGARAAGPLSDSGDPFAGRQRRRTTVMGSRMGRSLTSAASEPSRPPRRTSTETDPSSPTRIAPESDSHDPPRDPPR